MEQTLLLVDDDINVLSALKRLLHAQGYHILTASSGAEALQKLAQQHVEVIISDLRMPGMTGVELFKQVLKYWPDTVRIILSAYADFQSVTDAINEGAIYKFFVKPWDNEEMKEHVAQAFSHAQLLVNKAHHLQHHSCYDGLTKLPNRKLQHKKLQQAMIDAEKKNNSIFILAIDLDRFKNINDSFGQVVGDQLLQNMAQRIQECLEQGDMVARTGGNEFKVLLTLFNNITQVSKFTDKLLTCLSHPFQVDGHNLVITASIGISSYPIDSTSPDSLFRHAETAMYHSKGLGKNQYQFYCDDMSTSSVAHLTLETQLRYALQHDEFQLYYQPQVDLKTGQLVGFEALVRWQHPEMGLLPPGKFISLLEEISLIIPVGKWIIKQACNQNKAWQNAGLTPIRVAVNVSSYQLQKSIFVQSVEQALKESGLSPKCLEIEITEDTLIDNVEQCNEILQHLTKLGVRIAIDDFGTGYSSLSYLKQFPAQMLKIDQSFIKDICSNSQDLKIVSSIINMAHDLGLITIAEGVETKAQLQTVFDLGCDQVQGYFIDKPLTVEKATQLLKESENNSLLNSALVNNL